LPAAQINQQCAEGDRACDKKRGGAVIVRAEHQGDRDGTNATNATSEENRQNHAAVGRCVTAGKRLGIIVQRVFGRNTHKCFPVVS